MKAVAYLPLGLRRKIEKIEYGGIREGELTTDGII